jgi:hypothetical protein
MMLTADRAIGSSSIRDTVERLFGELGGGAPTVACRSLLSRLRSSCGSACLGHLLRMRSLYWLRGMPSAVLTLRPQ